MHGWTELGPTPCFLVLLKNVYTSIHFLAFNPFTRLFSHSYSSSIAFSKPPSSSACLDVFSKLSLSSNGLRWSQRKRVELKRRHGKCGIGFHSKRKRRECARMAKFSCRVASIAEEHL